MSDFMGINSPMFERQMTRNLRLFTSVFLALLGGTATATRAADLRITGVQPAPNGKLVVSGTGSSTASVDLEASSDFRNWTKLQSFAPGAAVTFTDSAGAGRSFYRLRSGNV